MRRDRIAIRKEDRDPAAIRGFAMAVPGPPDSLKGCVIARLDRWLSQSRESRTARRLDCSEWRRGPDAQDGAAEGLPRMDDCGARSAPRGGKDRGGHSANARDVHPVTCSWVAASVQGVRCLI